MAKTQIPKVYMLIVSRKDGLTKIQSQGLRVALKEPTVTITAWPTGLTVVSSGWNSADELAEKVRIVLGTEDAVISVFQIASDCTQIGFSDQNSTFAKIMGLLGRSV